MIAKQRPPLRPAPPKPWDRRPAFLPASSAPAQVSRPPEPGRRDRIYAVIVDYAKAHGGHTPSLRRIMQIANISSTSVVAYNIRRLVDDGRLEISDGHILVAGGRWIAPGEDDGL